jgi:hypothetical protein
MVLGFFVRSKVLVEGSKGRKPWIAENKRRNFGSALRPRTQIPAISAASLLTH